MPSYEHQQLLDQIRTLDQEPDDAESYATWLEAEGHLEILRHNESADELIVYAHGPHSFIHAVPVTEEALTPPDLDDLLRWSGNPFHAYASSYVWGGGRDDVWIEAPTGVTGSRVLSAAQPLLYGRTFEGLEEEGATYFELSQNYSHVTGAHHRRERSAYCRFDSQGDFEDLVSVTLSSRDEASLVTFKRGPLEEFLAASKSALVVMFDFTLFRYGQFTGWKGAKEELVQRRGVFFRRRIEAGHAAYSKGVQLVRPRRSSVAIFSDIKELDTQPDDYVSFIALDWRNECVKEISTDPRHTTSYFDAGENSLPFELSVAFFRPEVLAKYKNDTEKYTVEDRNIFCRGGWRLRDYDVNRAGQVHAYICDLRNLPSAEQLYWKSFNEKPKDGISDRARKRDFYGQWTEMDSLERIKQILRQWELSRTSWWTLRDADSMRRAATPRTGATDEWAREIKNLAILVVEGFELKAIRAKLTGMGLCSTPQERSIALLERVVRAKAAEGANLEGLRSVQRIRTKVDSHARGEEARGLTADALEGHGSYAGHFEHLCSLVVDDLERIQLDFGDGSGAAGKTP